MTRTSSRTVVALCTVAALAALLTALGSENFLGLVPCALCLVERWPYRIAIGLGVIGFVLPGRARLAFLWLIVLAMLAAAALAFVHVGVEQGYWPSPLPECAAPKITGSTIAERLASMPARPSKPCDDPTYLIPGLSISMAAMNFLFALAFAALLAIYLLRGADRGR
jgi:disulfide bond formation protein DsbB